MDHGGDDRGAGIGHLGIGVEPARLVPGGSHARTGRDGAGVIRLAAVVTFAEALAAPPGLAAAQPIAVVVSGLRRRAWREVDSPVTAQRIAARSDAVVLVTDPAHLRTVAGLASRLVDRGVRCWVSADAAELTYDRAAAAGSALGWGLTPS